MIRPQVLILDPYQSRYSLIVNEIIRSSTCFDSRIEIKPAEIKNISQSNPVVIISVLTQADVNSQKNIVKEIETIFPHIPIILIIDSNNLDFTRNKSSSSDKILVLYPPINEYDLILCLCHYIKGNNAFNVDNEFKTKVQLQFDFLKGCTTAIASVRTKIAQIAGYDVNVLISGDTGTGKELCAKMIHVLSHRSDKPFIPLNCGAVPSELIENELFGHHRGAYTGADQDEKGLLATAHQGTLFLDEIESFPEYAQVKLLRFFDEKRFRPLGQSEFAFSDVRIIAATNENLIQAIEQGKFRKDLFYRLNVVKINLPPLRERKEDIPILVNHFMKRYTLLFNLGEKEISPNAMIYLMEYDWPGNIRELENVIQATICATKNEQINIEDISLNFSIEQSNVFSESLKIAKHKMVEGFEKDYLKNVLALFRGNVSQASHFAQKDRRAFCRLLKKHQIDPSFYRPSLH